MIDFEEQRSLRESRKKNIIIAPRSSHGKLINGLTHYYAKQQNISTEELNCLINYPHTLFITCSDSAINPALLTSMEERELFVIRNIGNFVPPFHAKSSHSEAAAIEFALTYLDITDIVVCGHANCSAIKACQHGDDKTLPRTFNHWIAEIRSQLSFHAKTTINQISQRNILNQIENIKKYPAVQDKLQRGTLGLHAWFFDAEEDVMHEWDKSTQHFELIGMITTDQPV